MTLNSIKSILQKEKKGLYKLGIYTIGVFGSYARGDESDASDIDILIELSTDTTLTLFSLIALEQNLSEKLNCKVDLIIKSDLKPYIAKKILSEVQYV